MTNIPEQQHDPALSIRNSLKALRRHKIFILVFVLAVSVPGTVIVLNMPKIYRSSIAFTPGYWTRKGQQEYPLKTQALKELLLSDAFISAARDLAGLGPETAPVIVKPMSTYRDLILRLDADSSDPEAAEKLLESIYRLSVDQFTDLSRTYRASLNYRIQALDARLEDLRGLQKEYSKEVTDCREQNNRLKETIRDVMLGMKTNLAEGKITNDGFATMTNQLGIMLNMLNDNSRFNQLALVENRNLIRTSLTARDTYVRDREAIQPPILLQKTATRNEPVKPRSRILVALIITGSLFTAVLLVLFHHCLAEERTRYEHSDK